jgi:hypothetical protein
LSSPLDSGNSFDETREQRQSDWIAEKQGELRKAWFPVAGLRLFEIRRKRMNGQADLSAEVLGFAAIAVLGKSGYAYIKNRILGFLKQYGPPRKVGLLRYRIGLVMFCVPVLFGWLSPYAVTWFPALARHPLPYALGGDILIVSSLFVLGGDFWEKVRSLFIHDAEVRFAQVG